jgi:hypothetical protein
MSFTIVLTYAYVTCFYYQCISELLHNSFKRHFALWLFLLCHNAFRSRRGCSSHATTRFGCFKIATTCNFVLRFFLYHHNALWSFFALSERFLSLRLTYVYLYITFASTDFYFLRFVRNNLRVSQQSQDPMQLRRLVAASHCTRLGSIPY